MADGERERILADFQACSNLEDVETCIAILDQNEWNLMRALGNVMPGTEGQQSPVYHDIEPGDPSPMDISNSFHPGVFPEPIPIDNNVADSFAAFDPGSASGPSNFDIGPSTSFGTRRTGQKTRMLHFTIEYREKNIEVSLNDSETVGKIKEVIHSRLGVPPEHQELKGWKRVKADDSKILRDLHLPQENTLFLLTPHLDNKKIVKTNSEEFEGSFTESLNRTYKLVINFTDNGTSKEINLNVPGIKTVGEIKGDVYAITNVPARHQIWCGWPPVADDDTMTIGCAGLSIPEHKLTLTKSNITHRPQAKKTVEDVIADISDEEEDYQSCSFHTEPDDDMFESEDSMTRKMTALIPETVKDETEALEHFTREFRERYGENHPVFFVGTLENALKEALQGRAKDRKLLAIYLHHDNSILSNVFCSQVLCSDSIVNYLSNNFVTWAWDLSLETNNARLITLAKRHFGSIASTQIRNYRPDQLPVLYIISRSRSSNEVVDVIHGSVTLDELMTRLIHVVEVFNQQLTGEIEDESERDAREMIRKEQETAFQESLAADKAKAEALKLEREEEMKKQAEEQRQKIEEKQKQEALKLSAEIAMPNEPSQDCKDPITVLRIRTPDGETLSRRFRAEEPLKHLIYYVTSKGFHTEGYKLLTTFPRKDISQEDDKRTLQDLKLYPQETLMVEER
ncbi:FAF1 [Mytilus coruscus]|uniref:FAF1 n=1 Tax=Mytilus coruscus TaxID=42192 RepID=A0A6J8CSN1_MYTCO|nr:FAF1 [Mytilus coruscus]